MNYPGIFNSSYYLFFYKISRNANHFLTFHDASVEKIDIKNIL